MTFEDAYDVYKEQVTAGETYGADLVIIETMTDTYEMKAAILAVKETQTCLFSLPFRSMKKASF